MWLSNTLRAGTKANVESSQSLRCCSRWCNTPEALTLSCNTDILDWRQAENIFILKLFQFHTTKQRRNICKEIKPRDHQSLIQQIESLIFYGV